MHETSCRVWGHEVMWRFARWRPPSALRVCRRKPPCVYTRPSCQDHRPKETGRRLAGSSHFARAHYTSHVLVIPRTCSSHLARAHRHTSSACSQLPHPHTNTNSFTDQRARQSSSPHSPILIHTHSQIKEQDNPAVHTLGELFPEKMAEHGGAYGLFVKEGGFVSKGTIIGEYVGELK